MAETGTVEFYTDAGGRVRWRRRDGAGEILATSGGGFDTEAEAQASMLAACRDLSGTRVVRLGEAPGDTTPGDTPPEDTPPSYAPNAAQEAPDDTGGVEGPTEAPDPAGDEPGP